MHGRCDARYIVHSYASMTTTTPGQDLKTRRTKQNQTQKQLAGILGVTPNTVARWERSEAPIPDWVARVLAFDEQMSVMRRRIDQQENQIKNLQFDVAELRVKLVEKQLRSQPIIDLKMGQVLYQENLRLSQALQDAQRKLDARQQTPTQKLPESVEQVYRRLAQKYHPDRKSGNAVFMTDLNELYQACRAIRRV
jgi:transcriptional regulator with XRE-family HTH domain